MAAFEQQHWPARQQRLEAMSVEEALRDLKRVPLPQHGQGYGQQQQQQSSHKSVQTEVQVLMSKACEMFIQDMSYRGWACAEESNRKCMQVGVCVYIYVCMYVYM
jgi:hypothetical protein